MARSFKDIMLLECGNQRGMPGFTVLTTLPGVHFAVLPPHSDRPNPGMDGVVSALG